MIRTLFKRTLSNLGFHYHNDIKLYERIIRSRMRIETRFEFLNFREMFERIHRHIGRIIR